jgi:hypothetical protein
MPRMPFSHRYTLPPSLEGVADRAFGRATIVTTVAQVVVKAGSYFSMA